MRIALLQMKIEESIEDNLKKSLVTMREAGDQEQILYADIDFKAIDKIRRQRPYLKLRRPEFCTLVK